MRFYQLYNVELCEMFWQASYDAIGVVSKNILETIRTRMTVIFLCNGDFASSPTGKKERDLAILESMILILHQIRDSDRSAHITLRGTFMSLSNIVTG